MYEDEIKIAIKDILNAIDYDIYKDYINNPDDFEFVELELRNLIDRIFELGYNHGLSIED